VELVPRLDSLPPGPPLPPYTPRSASPAWSPDGTRLLFVNTASSAARGEGRIWEVGAEGGVAHPVTRLRGLAPVLSPDGAQLAFFARDSANRWQLWVQGRDGVAHQLTSHEEMITYRARWMPDGRALVYSADGGLWRVTPAGGKPQAIPFHARVTLPRRRAKLLPARFAPPGALRVAKGLGSMALSPDASRLAMIALDSLWIGAIGARPHALAAASGAGDNALTWSPDGRDVAWTRTERVDRPFDLVATDTHTGATRLIAAVGADVVRPVWSPDGRGIAFLAGGHLRVADPATPGEIRDLGSASAGWGTLSWSPGSEALLVAATVLDEHRQVAEWIPLVGDRHRVERFPRGAANLQLYPDGHAVWVENDLVWRAGFDGAQGLRGEPVPIWSDAAVEARYARDGTVLYLSTDGLRLRGPKGTLRRLGWPLRYRSAAAAPPLLIRGARLIDGRGSPLSEPSDVLLQGSRIARIAAVHTIPSKGIRTIDATRE